MYPIGAGAAAAIIDVILVITFQFRKQQSTKPLEDLIMNNAITIKI
jgi:hypothetical protein